MLFPDAREELHALEYRFQLRDGTEAVVRQLSAGGMFIETQAPLQLGQEVEFELGLPGAAVMFAATGVVAAQRVGLGGTGFHVRFISLQLRPAT